MFEIQEIVIKLDKIKLINISKNFKNQQII